MQNAFLYFSFVLASIVWHCTRRRVSSFCSIPKTRSIITSRSDFKKVIGQNDFNARLSDSLRSQIGSEYSASIVDRKSVKLKSNFEWVLKSERPAYEIRTNSRHFVKNHLKSGQNAWFYMVENIAVAIAQHIKVKISTLITEQHSSCSESQI